MKPTKEEGFNQKGIEDPTAQGRRAQELTNDIAERKDKSYPGADDGLKANIGNVSKETAPEDVDREDYSKQSGRDINSGVNTPHIR